MKRMRVIPVLLIQKGGLVKSVKFKDHKYVGDPINAVRIFNEKEVDEIVILDISATAEKRGPNLKIIKEIASEAFIPLGYGGGITQLDEIKELITTGVEKIILNTSAFNNPLLVKEGAKYAGSQSIIVSIDVKKNIFGKYKVYIEGGTKNASCDPVVFAKKMEDSGAGEIFLNAIDRDGTYSGYDLELIKYMTNALTIPLIACGGASKIEDFRKAAEYGASAAAAGSLFVFQRPHNAVLISYPSQNELKNKVYQGI